MSNGRLAHARALAPILLACALVGCGRTPPPSHRESSSTSGGETVDTEASESVIAALATSPVLVSAARLCSQVLELDAQHPCTHRGEVDTRDPVCWPFVLEEPGLCPAAPRPPARFASFVAFCRHGAPLPTPLVRDAHEFEVAFRAWELHVHRAAAAAEVLTSDGDDALGDSGPGACWARGHAEGQVGQYARVPARTIAVEPPVVLDATGGGATRSLLSGGFDEVGMIAQGLAQALEQRAREELEVFVVEKLGELICGAHDAPSEVGWRYLRNACTVLDAARQGSARSLSWAGLREALENDIRRLPSSIARELRDEVDARAPELVAIRVAMYLVSALIQSADPQIVLRSLGDAIAEDPAIDRSILLGIRFIEAVFALIDGPPVRETAFLGVFQTLALVTMENELARQITGLQRDVESVDRTFDDIDSATGARQWELAQAVDLDALERTLVRIRTTAGWLESLGVAVDGTLKAVTSLEHALRARRYLVYCAHADRVLAVGGRAATAILLPDQRETDFRTTGQSQGQNWLDEHDAECLESRQTLVDLTSPGGATPERIRASTDALATAARALDAGPEQSMALAWRFAIQGLRPPELERLGAASEIDCTPGGAPACSLGRAEVTSSGSAIAVELEALLTGIGAPPSYRDAAVLLESPDRVAEIETRARAGRWAAQIPGWSTTLAAACVGGLDDGERARRLLESLRELPSDAGARNRVQARIGATSICSGSSAEQCQEDDRIASLFEDVCARASIDDLFAFANAQRNALPVDERQSRLLGSALAVERARELELSAVPSVRGSLAGWATEIEHVCPGSLRDDKHGRRILDLIAHVDTGGGECTGECVSRPAALVLLGTECMSATPPTEETLTALTQMTGFAQVRALTETQRPLVARALALQAEPTVASLERARAWARRLPASCRDDLGSFTPSSLVERLGRCLPDLLAECGGDLEACIDGVDQSRIAEAQGVASQRLELIRELRAIVRETVSALRALTDSSTETEVRPAQLAAIAGHHVRALDLALRLATRSDERMIPAATDALVTAIAELDLAAIVAAALDVAREVLETRLSGIVPTSVVRALSLAGQVVEAETPEEVRDAVLQFAAPVGSWRGKRDGQWRLYLNGLVGVTAGFEQYSNQPFGYTGALDPQGGFGGHVSLGLYLNWGVDVQPFALGLYVPVLDVTPWTSLSTLGGDQVRVDTIDPLSILSPGLYFWWGIGESPIVIAVGYSFTPHGRTALHTGPDGQALSTPMDAHRVQLVLGVDVTLLPF